MQIKKFKALGISLITVAALLAAPISTSYAADAAKKDAKPMTCKQEAKKAGLKDKSEVKKFIKECKKSRKAAKKEAAGKK